MASKEMCIRKTPRLRTIREIDPRTAASGSQLTERALSTIQGSDSDVVPRKCRYSIMSDGDDDVDDDVATFDAEFSDFGV